MKEVFLKGLKNLGLFSLGIFIVLILSWLLYMYFYLHTPSTGYICGNNLCESVLPRIISSLSKTFLLISFLTIISIIILWPLVYRRKVSKVWIFCGFFVLVIIIVYFGIVKYVTRTDVTPHTGESYLSTETNTVSDNQSAKGR